MKTNLKPADELFQLRATIRLLRKREAELKEMMKADVKAMKGEFVFCHWRQNNRKTFNRKQAEAELGSLSRFDYRKEMMQLCVMPYRLPLPELEPKIHDRADTDTPDRKTDS